MDKKLGAINGREITSSLIGLTDPQLYNIDSVVKTSLLTTLAGYLESDSITVYGNAFADSKFLQTFLSYILNDKRATPRDFNLLLNFVSNGSVFHPNQDSNSYDCLVSFSGGIDSTAGLMYSLDAKRKVLPVWIGFGQKNENRELAVVNELCKKLNVQPWIIKLDLARYVDAGWSRWKSGIIPARNLLFASIAAEIASRSNSPSVDILLCAHKEEITPVNTDKSQRFYDSTTLLFNSAYKKNIRVTTPFYSYTKPEIVSYWSRYWTDRYGISPGETTSCYLGNNCGSCKACFNRAVAFTCSGYKNDHFLQDPFIDQSNTIWGGYITRFDSLESERQLDILYSLNSHIDIAPPRIAKFVEYHYPHFRNAIKKRQKQIRNVLIS